MNDFFDSTDNDANKSKWDLLMSDWGLDKTVILIGIVGIVTGVFMYFFVSPDMAMLFAGIGLSILIVGGALSANEDSRVIGPVWAAILSIIALVTMWQGPDYFSGLSAPIIWVTGAVFIVSLWVANSVGNRV